MGTYLEINKPNDMINEKFITSIPFVAIISPEEKVKRETGSNQLIIEAKLSDLLSAFAIHLFIHRPRQANRTLKAHPAPFATKFQVK